jgi:hypothetical protein
MRGFNCGPLSVLRSSLLYWSAKTSSLPSSSLLLLLVQVLTSLFLCCCSSLVTMWVDILRNSFVLRIVACWCAARWALTKQNEDSATFNEIAIPPLFPNLSPNPVGIAIDWTSETRWAIALWAKAMLLENKTMSVGGQIGEVCIEHLSLHDRSMKYYEKMQTYICEASKEWLRNAS